MILCEFYIIYMQIYVIIYEPAECGLLVVYPKIVCWRAATVRSKKIDVSRWKTKKYWRQICWFYRNFTVFLWRINSMKLSVFITVCLYIWRVWFVNIFGWQDCVWLEKSQKLLNVSYSFIYHYFQIRIQLRCYKILVFYYGIYNEEFLTLYWWLSPEFIANNMVPFQWF